MLATGGSAIKAIQTLKDNGVLEDKILFINLIASPEGSIYYQLTLFPRRFPYSR